MIGLILLFPSICIVAEYTKWVMDSEEDIFSDDSLFYKPSSDNQSETKGQFLDILSRKIGYSKQHSYLCAPEVLNRLHARVAMFIDS